VSTDLRSLARSLGGEVYGKGVVAPGPGHSPRDRSMSVTLSVASPDGFIVHSHAGDDWRMCRDYVRERLGMPQWQPGDGQWRHISTVHDWDRQHLDADADDQRRTEDDLVRIERAVKIWNEGGDPRGTAAERYLASRKLELPVELAGSVLRFHPRCPWRNENTGSTDYIRCLIAAFRSIDDDQVTGVHRIRVDQPQRWPKTDRRMLGIVHRAAVKLGPVGDKLTIGEGVETCLAARQLGYSPVWALGSVGAITFFPVFEEVNQLVILAEAGEASATALKLCARRWLKAGRRVRQLRSPVGSDLNDFIMSEGIAS
jgi:putative DNA primase/helicase